MDVERFQTQGILQQVLTIGIALAVLKEYLVSIYKSTMNLFAGSVRINHVMYLFNAILALNNNTLNKTTNIRRKVATPIAIKALRLQHHCIPH